MSILVSDTFKDGSIILDRHINGDSDGTCKSFIVYNKIDKTAKIVLFEDIKKKEFVTNLGNMYKQVYDFLGLGNDIRGKHNTENDNLYTLLRQADSVKFPIHTDGGTIKKSKKYKTKKRGGRLHMKTHRRK